MQQEIASLVHGVIRGALRLKARLEKGERPDILTEQAVLRGLLLLETEAGRSTEFRGESSPTTERSEEASGEASNPRAENSFLGIRYALVCWLDEFFILSSQWTSQWNERKLEMQLYGSNDRAWRFWEQARMAESRPRSDALEAIFWCVMLGFRGNLRDDLEQVRTWVLATKNRIAQIEEPKWPYPRDYELPPHVPPLRGSARLQRLIFTVGIVLLLLIPVLTFLVVQQLGQ